MRTSWLERGGFWDKGKKQAEKPELPVIREIPVESIRPNPAQPRLSYESGALEELAESIRENGLIQPILVRQLLDGDYELIAGHRRWMAVRKLGQPTIRAIVENRTDTESAVLALVENIQRRDLDCMEEARAIAGLIESTGMTQQEAARRLGKSQPAVANKLRLLRLPGWVQEIVEEGQLSERHARALLRLEREEDLRRVLDQVRRRNLTVEQTEALVDDCLSAPKEPATRIVLLRDYRLFVNTLNRAVQERESLSPSCALNRAVQTMAQAGIRVEQESREEGEYVEYRIRVPKVQAYRQPVPTRHAGDPLAAKR